MRLLADIGGTNARFAMADREGTVFNRVQMVVADHDRFEDALATYLAGISEKPTSAALSVAGPVVRNAVEMTNAPWTISEGAVRSVCPDIPVAVVNDLSAVAMAVPALDRSDFIVLHPGHPPGAPAPIVCINLGTGFGAAVAYPHANGWDAIATEAGHMTLALQGAEERALLGDCATLEDVFSGPGLISLQDRHAVEGIAPDVFRQTYSHVLGRVAGDLALATGAWGGIALCGGVLSEFDTVIDLSSFLSGLHTRRGLAQRLHAVPIRRLTCADPAFKGLLRLSH